jgi:hypothetical protein
MDRCPRRRVGYPRSAAVMSSRSRDIRGYQGKCGSLSSLYVAQRGHGRPGGGPISIPMRNRPVRAPSTYDVRPWRTGRMSVRPRADESR